MQRTKKLARSHQRGKVNFVNRRLSFHGVCLVTIAFLQVQIVHLGHCAGTEPSAASNAVQSVSIALFDIDATPPIGSMMAYDPVTNKWDLGLRARGLVILGGGDPIVLCAIDWIGIANEAYDVFRARLALAAGTSPERVAVHTLHQHDAPDCDFSAEKLLKQANLEPLQFDSTFQRQTLAELERAVKEALRHPRPVTELGLGQGKVEQVASNRRILGPDGKVRAVRYTACRDAALRAEPEGTIDPIVSLVSFWNSNQPVAVLSYYATHPQSYYRTGIPNPDFPGVARFTRQLAVPSALHIHFTGAGGNIGAGKYNDGSPENRRILAERLAAGMRQAWESTKREPLTPEMVGWAVEAVSVPIAKDLDEKQLEDLLKARDPRFLLIGGPSRLAWLRGSSSGTHRLELTCLRLGHARILHMPGELFVEYQLAAKAERPDLFVAMAAYGNYGPWYIGTAQAYEQGGYETSPPASNVGPGVEAELRRAMANLLKR